MISWDFIERLHELQEILHFKLANKLTSTHIRFRNSIMKVKFAAQVLSSSVADAIDFLRSLGLPDFRGSEATVEFIRVIDRVFDFLNSRHPFGKGYKAPIKKENLEFLRKESSKWISYFLKLKTVSDEPLYASPRRTFIIAYTTSIKSVLAVAENLFQSHYYSYILTYKFSQDLLELFFGIIRLRFGCNNNPTCYQFYFAMKTILLKNDISPSAVGNCLLLAAKEENSYTYGNFLNAECKKKQKKNYETIAAENNQENNQLDNEEEELLNSLLEMEEIDPKGVLRDFIVYHISGYVVRKLTKNVLNCVTCKRALLRGSNDHNYCVSSLYDRFVQYKNRGGLFFASRDVFLVVKECESFAILHLRNLKSFNYSKIILQVQQKMLDCNLVFKDLNCPSDEAFENHKLALIKHICSIYLKIRIFSLTNWENSNISSRKRLSKTILFNND